MKFTKMSLVAALLIGSSAFALENTKVSGDAKLFYSTSDQGKADFLDKTGAMGQAAFGLGLTTDLTNGLSASAHITALTTLGLQGQLVGGVWEATNNLDDSWWVDQAWISKTVANTTAKVGRMELDTPYVFTETWSIAENTFGAAVVINTDVPNTTLVGAYVGQGNGSTLGTLGNSNTTTSKKSPYTSVVGSMNPNGTTNFSQFFSGAYAAGATNKSWEPLTAQAWYFDATHAATAYWLEADLDASSLGAEGVTVGLQYTGLTISKSLILNKGTGAHLASDESNDAFAMMVGYSMKDMFSAKLSYSQTGKNNTSGIGAGMNLAASGQSKLYTESWWSYGYVTGNDTTAYNLTVEAPVNGMFDLGVYYTAADNGAGNKGDLQEFTMTASKSYGPLDTTLAYVNTKLNGGDSFNTVQAYLTLKY